MRFKKAIKKISALGTGAIMLGATIMGAAHAADLAEYPNQYVQNGVFNGVLVVGDKAAAEDVIGVTDIAISLQAAAVKPVAAGGGTSLEVEGDAWLIETSDHLELSEDLNSNDERETIRNITTFIDDNELAALSSGTITNNKATAPYNQYFYLLGPGAETALDTGYVIFTEDDLDVTADFLYFKTGKEIGRYLLEFTTALESDVDDSTGSASTTGLFLTDFEDVEIEMFGSSYTIVTARRTSTVGGNVKLTLMGGASKSSLMEGETQTFNVDGADFETTLNFVDADEAQFTVDGVSTRKLKDGDTDKLFAGTDRELTIGVSDILYQDYAGGVHSAGFFIGAQKMELKDTNIRDTGSTNALKVDDDSIDDATVTIEGTDDNSTFKITRIHVNMTADDDFFVPAGGKLSDAIEQEGAEREVLFTNNWDIEYRGLKDVATEEVKVKTSGSSQYKLEFVDGDGDTVSVPIAKATSASKVILGENDKYFINRENETITKNDYFVVTDSTRKRGERKTFILQYKGADKISSDNPVLKFTNVGSGETIEQTYSSGAQLATLKIGGADFKVFNLSNNGDNVATQGDIDVNDFDIRIDLDGSGALNPLNDSFVNITTNNGLEIGILNMTTGGGDQEIGSDNGIMLVFKTPDENRDGSSKDSVEDIQAIDYVINLTADSSTKVQMGASISSWTGGSKGDRITLRTPDGETNVEYGYTSYGTFITRETPSSEPATLVIEYPESQRYAQVIIATEGSSVSTSVAEGTAGVPQRIEVGAVRLASEVTDVKAVNSILVGGPCANSAAATIMGTSMSYPECAADFKPNTGLIKLYENGDNVAMVVAGFGAADTRNAATVVANYNDYGTELSGDDLEVKKVQESITVAAPAPEADPVVDDPVDDTTTTTVADEGTS